MVWPDPAPNAWGTPAKRSADIHANAIHKMAQLPPNVNGTMLETLFRDRRSARVEVGVLLQRQIHKKEHCQELTLPLRTMNRWTLIQ